MLQVINIFNINLIDRFDRNLFVHFFKWTVICSNRISDCKVMIKIVLIGFFINWEIIILKAFLLHIDIISSWIIIFAILMYTYLVYVFVWHTFSFRVQKDRLFFVRFSRPKKLERRILMIIQSYRFLAFFQKRKMVGESTSTQVLRDLEISLRTNHIE